MLRNVIYLLIQRILFLAVFGFNGPFRQYSSLYRVVSRRRRTKLENIHKKKNPNTHSPNTPPPLHTHTLTACAVRPLALLLSTLVGRSGTESSPSTFTPPDHPIYRGYLFPNILIWICWKDWQFYEYAAWMILLISLTHSLKYIGICREKTLFISSG